MPEGVWNCRMSCIEPGLPSGKVTNGGAFFCNKGVHQGGVWASGTSMEGGGVVSARGSASHQINFVAGSRNFHWI